MTTLLIKILVRSKGLMIAFIILLFSGIISLHIGKDFLEKNEKIIAKTAEYQKESIARNVEFHPKELGLLLYYLRFGLVNQMPQLNGLAIGQRDINPSLLSVSIRNLEEQKYTSDLINPLFQMLGNMDFSFVLIYLFPLVIIALGFNLVSEEKEDGTWSLVLSQSNNPLKMLKIKMIIRLFGILITLILLFIIAKFYLAIPFDKSFIAYILTSILYICFWFALTWLVVSFHKQSSQNAMILLITWLMLTIVIPAGINALNVYLYPVPEALNTILESRDGYHNKWDEPKEPTLAKFHKHYPELSHFKHPKDQDYSWLWYYAMQQMGDDEAAIHANSFKQKLRARNDFTTISGLFFPTIHAQLSLNSISKSDMDNYLNFIVDLEKFHEKKRLFYYPKIFSEERVSDQNWNKIGLEFFYEKQKINWALIVIPFLTIISICLFWASLNFTIKGK
jgi:ABC-2 type transport system permease protein